MRVWMVWLVAGCTNLPQDDEGSDTDGPCGYPTEDVDPTSWALDEPGPYQVGFRDWNVLYSPREGEDRSIRVSAWYPTDDTTGDPVTYSDTVPGGDELGHAAPAPPAGGCTYPVMAYSHGDRGYGATSHDLMRYFASHGWVAVAPDHTDNLLWADEEPETSGHWYHRPLDMSATLDLLETLPPDDPLAGRADTSKVLLSGHSRGTATVWALSGATYDRSQSDGWCPGCNDDQRALFDGLADGRMAAFMPLAGGYRTSLFGEDGHLTARGPWLLQSGGEDSVGANATFDLDNTLDFTWVEIADACHQTFALGFCGTLDTEVGYRIVNSYALAFGRAHILGDAGDEVREVLSGDRMIDARVTLTRKP